MTKSAQALESIQTRNRTLAAWETRDALSCSHCLPLGNIHPCPSARRVTHDKGRLNAILRAERQTMVRHGAGVGRRAIRKGLVGQPTCCAAKFIPRR
ncbi:hypothetical protein MRX96_032544 [Rhipicephalus microplus]